MHNNIAANPHGRYNPLLGEWILVSPHRTQRPWQGQTEKVQKDQRPSYDPDCYLCPGNKRASGEINPDYSSTNVFINDYSALLPDIPVTSTNKKGLLVSRSEAGLCKVICFSPRHDLTLGSMSSEQIRPVVDIWAQETVQIGSQSDISYVQIFENKGEAMGCSNPHPHGQIWATQHVPNIPALEDKNQREYMSDNGSCMLCDYLTLEHSEGERIVCENQHFIVLVPFWATWPFETMLLPKKHIAGLPQLSDPQRSSLADILRQIACKYDNVFGVSFPYSMGWHGKPALEADYKHWHLHAHFYPPLLRSATVKKFMVGFEMLAMPQRDITPETAALKLRELPDQPI